ncbi:hypothetical protein V6N12_050634 [Hibiscus sabdariffa]|uniref:Uncharacterized protein n=1 Tax=Hibiscus sabdariffa TaxID=183260 RepID=A0ABR2GCZ1_9ROSI
MLRPCGVMVRPLVPPALILPSKKRCLDNASKVADHGASWWVATSSHGAESFELILRYFELDAQNQQNLALQTHEYQYARLRTGTRGSVHALKDWYTEAGYRYGAVKLAYRTDTRLK